MSMIQMPSAYSAARIHVLRAMLHGFDYSDFRTRAFELLPAAANHILGLDDGKQRFVDHVLAATKALALCGTLDDALQYRDELAFFQAIRFAITKHYDMSKPDISILSDGFSVKTCAELKERNLAVEMLERLLKDEVKARFRTNVVQSAKYTELLEQTLIRFRNRTIETAQVIEELIAMAKQFREAAARGERLGLQSDELAFYDALADNEFAVRELGDETLRIIAVELTERLRKSVTVDWAVRENVRARIRVMVRTLLRRYKYPRIDKNRRRSSCSNRQRPCLRSGWRRQGEA